MFKLSLYRKTSDVVFDIVNYVLLTIALLVVLYPLYFIVIASVSDPVAVLSGKVFFGVKGFSLLAYERILVNDTILTGYRNSLLYMLVGTIINLALTFTAAYPLSRKDLKGRGIFMFILTFTMFFSGGLIPTYLLVKSLGMVNTFWAMVIPNAVAVWNIIIARTYFQSTVPDELLDAAVIDGCTNANFFIRVVIPLSSPIIAVMTLFYAVGHWNAFMQALIYIQDRNLYPLQLVLRNILITDIPDQQVMDPTAQLERVMNKEMMKYGLIIVSSLPVLIIYPFVQKYFVKGIMIGSLKG